jgi:hypothetical protein
MWPVKPMVSSSLLDEALCAAASHIMVSNRCSGASAFRHCRSVSENDFIPVISNIRSVNLLNSL